ncbi:lipase ZK262.3-like [Mercenaria mercenaria]|uniref:lipase ZK262.3-like n=1 Tax=Mercenaria mercenaria TaxID=6596 RepID=UPI00234F9434|nr:lipase ZK262.3-like [Mercenaria mercenaria]
MASFYLLLIYMLIRLSQASPTCGIYMDCKTCADGGSCRWCPLDRNCHDKDSLRNSCLKNQNIVSSTMCKEMKYGKYDPKAAFSYTLMSAAAYSKDPQYCLKQIYPSSDFKIEKQIRHRCEDLPLFRHEECFAYTSVSHEKKIILVAYRGTIIHGLQILDQIVSILTEPKTSFPAGGKVQHYFANAHKKLYQGVNASVTSLLKTYPTYDIVITGHSLGGALASLAAVSLVYHRVVPVSRMSLYTFGSPRVGDKEYALNHDQLVNNSWRVVHNRDIVSHLPTCNLITGCTFPTNGPYHHRTEIFYPNVTMNKGSLYVHCKGDDDDNCSDGAITNNPCTIDLIQCIEYHLDYFGLHVGTICDHV